MISNIASKMATTCQFGLADTDLVIYHMGCDARKPVFGVSDKARLKPVSLATETS